MRKREYQTDTRIPEKEAHFSVQNAQPKQSRRVPLPQDDMQETSPIARWQAAAWSFTSRFWRQATLATPNNYWRSKNQPHICPIGPWGRPSPPRPLRRTRSSSRSNPGPPAHWTPANRDKRNKTEPPDEHFAPTKQSQALRAVEPVRLWPITIGDLPPWDACRFPTNRTSAIKYIRSARHERSNNHTMVASDLPGRWTRWWPEWSAATPAGFAALRAWAVATGWWSWAIETRGLLMCAWIPSWWPIASSCPLSNVWMTFIGAEVSPGLARTDSGLGTRTPGDMNISSVTRRSTTSTSILKKMWNTWGGNEATRMRCSAAGAPCQLRK